jgi:tetratricopeptide (TPR) repeat protein
MGKKVKHIPSRVPQKKMPSTTALMDQMVALYNGGQWDLLVTMATNMTKLIPSHIFGWRALSKALLMSGKPSEAINALIEFAKLSPNDPDIYSDLAHAHRLLGEIEEAEKNYRLVIKIDPTSAVTHNRLGSIYCDAERFSDAEKEFHRAVEIDPAFIQAHINLGYATETLGRWDDAEVCYRNAITLNPNYSEAHKRLGNLLALISRRRAESVISFERAIELNPGDANLYVSLGNVFLAEKNTDKSLAMFRRARQLEPLISWPSKQTKADFSVLLLDAPEAGCTPVSYLVGRTNYESHFVALILGEE